jgi:hypothetical protein
MVWWRSGWANQTLKRKDVMMLVEGFLVSIRRENTQVNLSTTGLRGQGGIYDNTQHQLSIWDVSKF